MLNQVILCVILLFSSNQGLEFNNNRYNPSISTDFLQHEGGVYGQKNDGQLSKNTNTQILLSHSNQNGGKRDYVAQLPALSTSTTSKVPTAGTTIIQQSGKRDYVAQFPQLPSPTAAKPQSTNPTPVTPTTRIPQTNGRRDYVAPQYTTLKPAQGNAQPSTLNIENTHTTNPKRDYIAPNYPTLKPVQGNSGKVKDLINFYDGQSNGQHVTPKIPSYSSILNNKNTQGSSLPTQFTQTTPNLPSTPTKPWSYSSILSGSKTPAVISTTLKPTTKVPTNNPTTNIVRPNSISNKNTNTPVISSGPATDLELQTLSEELLRKDINNAAKYVTINYQDKTTSYSQDDRAPGPLLTVSPEAWKIPTIKKFVPLLDNYERDTLINEYVTPLERNEENEFMDAIMSTSVIRHLMNFLKTKGIVTPDPKQQRDYLKQLWFSLYSRGKGKISSSGFEHIFVSELKNGEVSGLHNWIYFAKEEAANRINYLGYLKYTQFDDKGAVLKHHFNQQGADKPVDSMFIGTSPELEISLYTLCFVTRADNECKLKLGNKDVEIVTHTFRYRSKNLIGSGYPQI